MEFYFPSFANTPKVSGYFKKLPLYYITTKTKKQSSAVVDSTKTNPEDAKQALFACFNFFNNEDLSDSLKYNQFEKFFADDLFYYLIQARHFQAATHF